MTAKTPPRALIKVFVALHNFIYRVSGGRVAGRFGKGPVLLLTVKGRKTGKPQTIPLIYVAIDGGFAVIASFAGSPTHPAWYLNLQAAGAANVQVGGKQALLQFGDCPNSQEDIAREHKRDS